MTTAAQRSTGIATDLFEPAVIAGLDLPTRFAMAPMTRFRSPAGVPGAKVVEYYRRRAEGGIGLIISEGILVDHPSAGFEDSVPRLSSPAAIRGWRQVVDGAHAAGGRMLAQLWHQGSERRADDGVRPWTPSGVREDGGPMGHAMSTTDIDVLTQAYADAAIAAERAGFDGVEVHAAHGYLLDEFLWPATNLRSDGYGGGMQARARFVAEIVAAIRAATRPGFPIGLRFSQFKERDFSAAVAADPHELAVLLESVVDAGVTLLHASARRFWEPAFSGSDRTLAGWTRHLTDMPTIAVGSVGLRSGDLDGPGGGGLASLARLREREEFDLIAVGRALLANPRWVEHVRDGHHDQIVDYTKEHELSYP